MTGASSDNKLLTRSSRRQQNITCLLACKLGSIYLNYEDEKHIKHLKVLPYSLMVFTCD